MSRSFWKADKPAPEPGQVWRRKRNGRHVTVIQHFEPSDADPFAYLHSCSNQVLRRLADECEAIIAGRAEDGVTS